MNLDDLITAILKREGDEYTNHPADKGGPTKYGITLLAWEDYIMMPAHETDIMDITEDQARAFYTYKHYYEPKFDKLPEALVELVVDAGVNHGVKRAAKWLQKAVRALEDGVIGPKTLAAVKMHRETTVYLRFIAYRVQFYGMLVSDDPKLALARDAGLHLQAEFAEGWNNRAASFILSLADRPSLP